ncbi:MAG: RagB/SusD family nutrient uptake outer membrane protein, partial [Candidatus Symbiothrix sp.]|nr:RagB/SusD family nutrient uptake outer membrane protein [Candidatus Symbiothrix sp.]
MKKIISTILITLIFVSCEDFLTIETTNLKNTENYPANPAEASQVLTGIYAILSRPNIMCNTTLISELRSDDRLGGGGPGDISTNAIAQYQKWSENCFQDAWNANYMGVYRANVFMESSPRIKWESEAQQKQMEGEAHYLRAHFYFDLSRLFGDVCLQKTSQSKIIPRTPAAETYAFIASDLKAAIEKLPEISYVNTESGRVTRWAAQALMARVFLFYTGYYNKESLPLPEGGKISKADVIAWLDECTNTSKSGHDLVSDFRNLWPYSYVQEYAFTKNNNLKWEGDGNKETVFAIKYSNKFATHEFPYQKSNQVCLFFGLRGQDTNYKELLPFGEGWGFGTVNPKIWNDWADDDIRKKGSMFTATDRNELRPIFKYGTNAKDPQMEETTFYQKKYIPINVYRDVSRADYWNYSCTLYGNTVTDFKLNNTQDMVLIRFADVLLMAAELNEGTDKGDAFLKRVRDRVNLPPVPATLANIKQERRFELAFEGIRFFDLLRWHDEQVLTDNQKDI